MPLVFPSSPIFCVTLMLVVGAVVFAVFFLFRYWPVFADTFLPHVETIKEAFEHKQLEQQEKCRQAQLSNLSLVLFFYAFTKTSNLETIQCNDASANLLTKLFGVDQGSQKKNLELVMIAAKELCQQVG